MDDKRVRSEVRKLAKDVAWGQILLAIVARSKGEKTDSETCKTIERAYFDYHHQITNIGESRDQRKSVSGVADANPSRR